MNKREEVQIKATKKVLESGFNGILNISPRVGKTKVILDALTSLNKHKFDNVLVTAPYTDILNSWKEEHTKWKCSVPLEYTTNVSLSKQDVPDLLVIDECQELSPANIEWIKESNIKHIILMSGTIGEKTYKNLSVLGRKEIYKYSIDEAIEDGIVNDYEIKIQYIPLNNTNKYISAGTKDKSWLQTEYADYTWLDKNFKKWRSLEWNCQAKDKAKFAHLAKKS